MRDPKGKTAAQMFPELFKDDDDDETPSGSHITDEERDELLDLIRFTNAKNGKPK